MKNDKTYPEGYPDREYTITKWWYTSQRGKTIEETIDTNLPFFLWAVKTFQDVTPSQAKYFADKYPGHRIPEQWIRDVTPYDHVKNDPEVMYHDLCWSNNLELEISRYRGIEETLFSRIEFSEK